MNKKQTWVKKRHRFFYILLKWPAVLYVKLAFHYAYKPFQFDRKQQYIILSNHQTDADPIFIYAAFKKNLYALATDSLLSNGLPGKFISYAFAPIPKKKGTSDVRSLITMMQVVKEGGNILIFPEGNRSYGEFQYKMDEGLPKLIKKMKLPVMLVNIHGGTGVSPRFSKKNRKGKITCNIQKNITVDELTNMSNEDLLNDIATNLKVYDSESNQLFKSNKKAEYLERMFFYCPVCKQTETLRSNGNLLSCKCGLEVQFNENLTFSSTHPDFSFKKINDWYQA